MTAQAAHASYLKSLRLLGHSLGGLPIFDQLRFGKHSLPFLNEYLPMISVGEARAFVDCAALLLDRSATEIKAYLQSLLLFHAHYVNSEDDALFSPDKLNYLIFRVCDAKKIAAPESARILRLEEVLMYVCKQFSNGFIETEDLFSMVRSALEGFSLPASRAVDFFKYRIPDVAERIASRFDLPMPFPSFNDPNRPDVDFRNPTCHADHVKAASVMNNVTEVVVVTETALESFREELKVSNCLALNHHEPPYLMPTTTRIDLISVRTLNCVFHLPTTIDDVITAAFIGQLKIYNENGVIYARYPYGQSKTLLESFGWSPALTDVRPYVDRLLGKNAASLAELADKVVGGGICWRAKVFTASVIPSRMALTHRAIVVSLIYKFGVKFVRTHSAEGGEPSAEDEQERQRIREEQERLRDEEEEEQRRLQQELEEKRQREEEALNERQRKLDEEAEKLARRQREKKENGAAHGGGEGRERASPRARVERH